MTNRVIKFRAWDKKRKVLIWTEENTFWDFLNSEYFPHLNSKDYELMQFTGLLDKNGKEIYEGDVLGQPNKGIAKVKDAFGTHYAWFAPVIWNVDRWTLKGCEKRSQKEAGYNQYWNPLMLDENAAKMEVIGSIYENPELLNHE